MVASSDEEDYHEFCKENAEPVINVSSRNKNFLFSDYSEPISENKNLNVIGENSKKLGTNKVCNNIFLKN